MNKEKTLSLLGFAAKAGKLSYGTHATEFAITSGKVKLVLSAEDISEKSVKELKFKADKKSITVLNLEGISTAELSKRVGKNCGILAVTDGGFADAISKHE